LNKSRSASSGRNRRGWGLATLGLFCFCLFAQPGAAGPLSERLVFVAPVHGLAKIFLCRPDGRDLHRLTRTPGEQLEPYYCEALQRFFFVRTIDRRQQIFSVDREGEDLRQHTGGVFQSRYPHLRADGKKMVYATDKWGAFELAEQDLDSGESTRLTYDQAINIYPRYSPDGTAVLYLSRRHGQSELYLRDLASGDTRQLTQTPFDEGPANWRPDGRRIVATRITPPRMLSKLLEIDLSSQVERVLLPEVSPARFPVYSKDGSLIVFVKDQAIFSYDPSDTAALPFPMRGQLNPEFVQWADVPLP
jgi:Tol biopolymer transport system component